MTVGDPTEVMKEVRFQEAEEQAGSEKIAIVSMDSVSPKRS